MLTFGQDESSELLKAIEDSQIYLVVFSINYAFSTECLDELVLITECVTKFKKRRVFPIFFNVAPSQVRSQQEGSFLEAFQEHESNINPQRVQKWRQALKLAGQLAGLTFENGDEGKFLRKIVKLLGKMKNPLELFDATHPIGIESRVQDLVSKLRLGDNAFTILVVLGIGGSGKTTIVKAVYDRIVADFDANCFIENIRDYQSSDWKNVLQQKVISCLTGNHQFYNVEASMITKLINGRKVLLVLDDVDKFEQLQALGIHLASSFGCESRIIVTTRNKQSLSILPYTPYEIRLLNINESFDLFMGLAFEKGDTVDRNFVNEIVFRAAGLPLVLEVWGRHFNCHERKQWPNLLEKLKKIPHENIQKKLQLGYDSLTNRSKKLFLDIVYFFYGMRKDLVVKVLQDEDLGFFSDIEIQYLVDKSLVKIDKDKVSMHHAIREMGQEVVRQENEDEPGQRSRLMGDKDVVRILRECSGTESIESIRLCESGMKESETVHLEAFKKMSNLRFIQLLDPDSQLQWSSSGDDDVSFFSFKKLKYLEWYEFPCKCINIGMGNVVVIKLQHSKLEILWEGFKSLKKLRILNVSYSRSLTKTGSFVGLDKLEELILNDCENLEELDSSISCLGKLALLNLSHCTRSKRFSCEMIGKLTSLVQLNVRDCRNILNTLGEVGSLPDNLRRLHGLKWIELSGCANLNLIPNLPPNIKYIEARNCINLVNLKSNMSELQFLERLMLDGCLKLGSEGFKKVTRLRSLTQLSMRKCNVSHVSSEIGNLVSLRYLDLSENPFSSLPDSFSNLSKLVKLKMIDCSRLQLLPLIPSNLKDIEAFGCWSLYVMPYYDSMQMVNIFRSKMLQESFFTKPFWIILSGEEVPEWCSYRSNGNVLSLVAPMHLNKKICGVIICATFTTEFKAGSRLDHSLIMLNKTKDTSRHFNCSPLVYKPYMCVMFSPLNDTTVVVEAGDAVIVEFENKHNFHIDVLNCGLRWIYEGEVVDSALLIQILIEPPTLVTVPKDITAAAASITQFYDDSVYSFPYQDNECLQYNFFPDNFSSKWFKDT